jgi:hypothetical protein
MSEGFLRFSACKINKAIFARLLPMIMDNLFRHNMDEKRENSIYIEGNDK